MDIDQNNIDETSGLFTGGGWGIDLGANLNFTDRLDISWSFSNLFASINWNTNTLMFLQSVSDSLETSDLLNGEQGVNYSSSDTIVNAENFSTPLPSIMRLGVAFHILEDLTISGEYRQGLDNYFGNSITPRFGGGVEYMATSMLPLRAGVTFGGKYGYLLGLGAGFHSSFFHFDFATAFSRAAMPSATTGVFASFSFKFLF
jgi:long-subunit fatty acid transport protein